MSQSLESGPVPLQQGGHLEQELTSAPVLQTLEQGQDDKPYCAGMRGQVRTRRVSLGCEVLAGHPRGQQHGLQPSGRVRGLAVPGQQALVGMAVASLTKSQDVHPAQKQAWMQRGSRVFEILSGSDWGSPSGSGRCLKAWGFLVEFRGRVLELGVPAQAGPGSCRHPFWVEGGASGPVSKTWGPIFIPLPNDIW